MGFVYPQILYAVAVLAVLIGILAVVEWVRGKRGRQLLRIPSSRWARRAILKYLFLGTAGALILIALSQPFLFGKRLVRSAEDMYVMYVFDLSWSMEAKVSEDAPTRLDRAKEISLVMLSLFGGGNVGVYGFTDRFGSFANFTTDHSFVRETIKSVIRIESLMGTGSNITGALQRAAQQFLQTKEAQQKKKLIILLSDGGDPLSVSEVQELDRTVSFLKQKEIKVVAIGVGEFEPQVLGERYGKPIVSKLEEATLQRIAQGTEGRYVREADDQELFSALRSSIPDILGKDALSRQETKDISGWFIAGALVPLWFLWFFFGGRIDFGRRLR